MQIPVRDLLDGGIGHIRGQARHGLRAEIAAISHDGRDDLADVVRRAAYSLTLSRRAHQLLMLIVSAPLIGVEDLCVLCQVRADAMGEMLRELTRA